MNPEFKRIANPKEVYQTLQKPWNQIPLVNLKESEMVQRFIVGGTYRGIDCELLRLKVDAILSRRMLATATGAAIGLASQGIFSELSPIVLAVLGICSAGSLISNKLLDRTIQEQTGIISRNE